MRSLFRLKTLFLTFLAFFCTATIVSAKQQFTIVIDAGHGGHDSGARGSGTYEKIVTLSVALKLGKLIEKKQPDVKVIYTRTTDEFIALKERAAIANRNHANLFVSIHCNSSPKSSPSGTETYALGTHRNADNFEVAKRENSVILLEDDYKESYAGFDPNSPESVIGMTLIQGSNITNSLKIADNIEKNFIASDRSSRGVKQAGFLVLVQTSMPAILIETGFISNPTEGSFLASDSGQNQMAKNIYDAFTQYKNEFYAKNDIKIETPNKNTTPIIAPKPSTTPSKDKSKGKEQTPIILTNRVYLMNSNRLLAKTTPVYKVFGSSVDVIKQNNIYYYYTVATMDKAENSTNLRKAKANKFSAAKEVGMDEQGKLPRGEYYTIELMSSNKKIKPKDKQFKGLRITRNKVNGVFYYTTGKLTNYASAKQILNTVVSKGFSNAVIQKIGSSAIAK